MWALEYFCSSVPAHPMWASGFWFIFKNVSTLHVLQCFHWLNEQHCQGSESFQVEGELTKTCENYYMEAGLPSMVFFTKIMGSGQLRDRYFHTSKKTHKFVDMIDGSKQQQLLELYFFDKTFYVRRSTNCVK